MKIKADFVTNSSSSSFIVGLAKTEFKDFKEYIDKLNRHPDASNEGVDIMQTCKSLDDLNTYTNDHPYDWASKARGFEFRNLSEEAYDIAKEMLEQYDYVSIVSVDYNVCEEFDDEYGTQAQYNPDY